MRSQEGSWRPLSNYFLMIIELAGQARFSLDLHIIIINHSDQIYWRLSLKCDLLSAKQNFLRLGFTPLSTIFQLYRCSRLPNAFSGFRTTFPGFLTSTRQILAINQQLPHMKKRCSLIWTTNLVSVPSVMGVSEDQLS